MTAQHMVEHLGYTVVGSTILSSKKEPAPLNSFQQEFKQVLIFSDADMQRGLQNPMFQFGLPPYQYKDIEEAKKKLVEKIFQYYKILEANPTALNFTMLLGDINFEESQIFHYKHFKHHFTQFELL